MRDTGIEVEIYDRAEDMPGDDDPYWIDSFADRRVISAAERERIVGVIEIRAGRLTGGRGNPSAPRARPARTANPAGGMHLGNFSVPLAGPPAFAKTATTPDASGVILPAHRTGTTEG